MPLSDLFAAIRWWAALLLLGAAATPLAYRLFRWLPDRGYAFVKMLALLLVSYFFWLLGSLGFLGNNLGGILFGLLLLLALSAWALRGQTGAFRAWLRERWRYLLLVEILFAAIFFFWAWVRAQNPAITATEKPMEFAFLNAAGRSAAFPPLDPWLSGFAISYYYFGYIMTSVLARLAVVAEPIAFNLGIAWLTAGAAIGAFGIVYNLVAADRDPEEPGRFRLPRAAVVLGVVAAVAVPLAGNMEILLELLHAQGIGSAGFWAWLDVTDLTGPAAAAGTPRYQTSSWWWWRASRVIHEYDLAGIDQAGLEPIAEFPGFSFILGDMHPHVLALPFAFLSLGVALLWWLRPPLSLAGPDWDARGLAGRFGLLLGEIGLPLWALTVLVLGGLSFLNTWDVLIHLFLILGAFVLNQWQQRGGWDNRFLGQALMVAVLLALPAVLLYLPFYLGFRSQAGAPYLLPMLMRPTRLAHFLIIFAMPLWSILTLVVALLLRQRQRPWRVALLVGGGLVLLLLLLLAFLSWIVVASPAASGRVSTMAADLGLNLPLLPVEASLFSRLGWAASVLIAMTPAFLLARLQTPWLTLMLAALIGVVAMLWAARFRREPASPGEPPSAETDTGQPSRSLPFVLLLVFTGALLTLGPEFLYLRDNFGVRLNTIFKFYYQAWVLFGVSALFALAYLWRRTRPAAVVAAVGYGAMLIIALLFPYYAISSRAEEYGNPSTLNGIDHYRYSNPDELAALTWLRENVQGTPVILEAVGGQYSPYGRVSATTGLPTLLGWPGHEYQWRGDTPEPAVREPAVRLIYAERDWEATVAALNQYNVEFIYVGPLELSTYGPTAAEKFAGRLEVAYANDSVTIYRWLPS